MATRINVKKREVIDSDHLICGNCINFVKRARDSYYCTKKRADNVGDKGRTGITDRACYRYEFFELAEEEIILSPEEKEKLRIGRMSWTDEEKQYLMEHAYDSLQSLCKKLPRHSRESISNKRTTYRKNIKNGRQ